MKSKKFAALSTLLFLSIIGVAAGTLSWFITSTAIDEYNVSGKTAGAYFAYGNGNASSEDPKDRPYGISHPRHLYNLAWLHYTGYFDDKQYYFELADSIPSTGLDMTGYILPPIGTEDNPFVSNFNGNGKIIKNLTVSNDSTVLFANSNKHPDPDSVSFTSPEIVGMFGVVGNLSSAYSGTYDTATNSIYNLGLSNIDIESNNAKALAGIVAGYVDATIENVAVTDGSIDIQHSGTAKATVNKTNNLSDYTIVGYCTDNYKTDVESTSEKIYGLNVQNKEFVVADNGDDTGLGGSINMTDLFNRIVSMKGAVNDSNHAFAKTVTYAPDGSVASTTPTTTYLYRDNFSNEQIGGLSIVNDTINGSRYSGSSAFMYLAGGSNVTSKYQEYTEHSGYYITDGTNYLTFNAASGTLTNTTSSANATIWSFSRTAGTTIISCLYQNVPYYLDIVNNSLSISTTSGSTYWTITPNGDYLQLTNGAWKIGYYNSAWGLFNDNGDPYYVIKANGQDRWMTTGSNGGTPGNTTTIGSASHWYIDTANNNYLYYLNGNTKMYLTYYQRNNYNYGIRVYSTLNASYYYYFSYLDGEVKFVYGSDSYYLRYNSGWSLTDNSSYASTYVIGGYTPNAAITALKLSNTLSGNPVTREGPDIYEDSSQTTTKWTYDGSDTTYLPLNVVSDGTKSAGQFATSYIPKDNNTGYMVAGTTATQNSPIRVSQYGISYINSSYPNPSSTKNLTNIYTVNASNQIQRIGANYYNSYTEFSSASEKLQEVLSQSTSYVYGLHFMSAQISKDALVIPKYAKVNGTEYYQNNVRKDNYQLPINSIDFNLKQKGFINFFAGMYYSTNDSFFSLHHIRRNADNTIAEIKEIVGVYSDGYDSHGYVYKYSDNKYTVPFITRADGSKTNLDGTAYNESTSMNGSAPGGSYSLVFDTSRITNYRNGSRVNNDLYCSDKDTIKTATDANGSSVRVNRSIFYFEIPMNIGEFALGSVNGGTGGYLFYLDIGANAAKMNRTTIVEKFVSSTEITVHPKGVAFVETFTITDGVFVVDASNSACVSIAPSYEDTLNVSRTGNTVTVGGYDSDYITGKYKKNTVTLVDSSANTIEVIPKTEDKTTWRMTFLDYNPLNEGMTRTVITDVETVTDGDTENPVTTRVVQQYNESGTLVYDSSSDDPNLNTRNAVEGVHGIIFIYDSNEGINKGKNIANANTIVIDTSGADHGTIIATINIDGSGLTYDEVIYDLVYSLISNSVYYQATRYTVTLSNASGTVTITTTPYSGSNPSYSGITIVVNGYVITITGLQVPYIPPSS